eukprot:gene39212-biopygen17190
MTRRYEAGVPVAESPAVPVSFTNKHGAAFEGLLVNANKKHGKGEIKYPDGSVYEGEWVNNKRHGAGRLTSATGEVFEGVFEKDVPVSGKGVLTLKEGGKYEGELVQGKRHGLAKITHKRGKTYEIEYIHGEKVKKITPSYSGPPQPQNEVKMDPLLNKVGEEGEAGQLVHGDILSSKVALEVSDLSTPCVVPAQFTNKQGAVFDGVYLDESRKQGKGQIKYVDGSVYEGEWMKTYRHGAGRLTSAAGEVFEGVFEKNNPVDGKGVLPLLHGGKYEGELVEGKRHGLAKITNAEGVTEEVEFAHGKVVKKKQPAVVDTPNLPTPSVPLQDVPVYKGSWRNGKRHGSGKLTFSNGDLLEGEFREDKLWNGVAVHTLSSGDIYDGAVREGKHHGQGKVTHPDGRTLEGEFKEGRLWNGRGVFIHKDGTVYEGEFKEGKMHGQGKLIYPEGRTQEGEFKKGRLWNGSGVYTLKSGDVYEGEFQSGTMHGRGKLTTARAEGSTLTEGEFAKVALDTTKLSGEIRYVFEGEFRENQIWSGVRRDSQGQVTRSYEAGRLVAETSVVPVSFTNKHGAVFDGVLINSNKKHGKGQIKYPDGSIYEGEWLKDKRHGAGRLTSAAGEVFEGVFEKDVPVSGKGVLPLKDGGKYEGELVQGKRHGQGKIISATGDVKKVHFAMGKKVLAKSEPTSTKPGSVSIETDASHGQPLPSERLHPAESREGGRLGDKLHKKRAFLNSHSADSEFRKGEIWNGRGMLTLKSGDIYEGEFKDGKMHGQGKLTHPDGNAREGEFKEGKFWNGTGTLTLKSGDVYEGEFKEGIMRGQGKLTYPDGRTLEGEFKEGKIWNGSGKLTFKNGDFHEGEFKEGKMHGQGKVTRVDGGVQEGEFKDGRLWNGRGVFVHKSGYVYEGEFKEGKMHGQGKLTHSDGRNLEGEFKKGKLWNGTGTLALKSGDVYEGEFEEGKMHGQGKLTTAPSKEALTPKGEVSEAALDTNKLPVENRYVLEGEFRGNKFWNGVRRDSHGQVTRRYKAGVPVAECSAVPVSFTNKHGAAFEGVLVNANKKYGKGQIKYTDGSVYEGEWLKEKRHGAGRLTSTTGEVFEGVFEKDVPVSGKGVLLLKNGGKCEGELVQGKRHG